MKNSAFCWVGNISDPCYGWLKQLCQLGMAFGSEDPLPQKGKQAPITRFSWRDCLGGGFKYVLFSPLFGEDSHFDEYFSKGLKPPSN